MSERVLRRVIIKMADKIESLEKEIDEIRGRKPIYPYDFSDEISNEIRQEEAEEEGIKPGDIPF